MSVVAEKEELEAETAGLPRRMETGRRERLRNVHTAQLQDE